MNNVQKGKISRLPHHIREQVHIRLRDGQRGRQIVSWLNSLAEARQEVALSFGGHPISERNLSEWKQRAHPAWLLQQETLAEAARFMAQSCQLAQAGKGAVTDHLATFVAAHYAVAIRRLRHANNESEHWRFLRQLCQDVSGLRRCDQAAERMRLQRRHLDNRIEEPIGDSSPSPPRSGGEGRGEVVPNRFMGRGSFAPTVEVSKSAPNLGGEQHCLVKSPARGHSGADYEPA
ncbi:MAG: hypothetical protein ABSA47_14165 [Verrucomicrobiota bacterium]